MPELETRLPDGTPLYAVVPAGARRGMIVIHEIFGRQPEIDRVVQRFAAAGYAAAAPDLFGSGARLACIRSALRSMGSGKGPAIDAVRAARLWLCEQAGFAPERVGLIGFCFGGGFALAAGPGFAAVSTNYGEVPPTEVMRGIGPVIGCYAGRDRLFDNGGKLAARLAPLGVTPEVHHFESVGHSFLTDGRHPIAFALSRFVFHAEARDPAVREAAWAQILEFFERKIP